MRLLFMALVLVAFAGCMDEAPEGQPNGGDPSTPPSPPATPPSNPATPPDPVTHEVAIANFAFDAQTVTIFAGDTVRWTNQDQAAHTVSEEAYVFESGSLGSGEAFSFTFDEAGTFAYRCDFHPSMVGWVVVE